MTTSLEEDDGSSQPVRDHGKQRSGEARANDG
jgi:hypothetical protein